MIADDIRRPYQHPYAVTARGERPASPTTSSDDHPRTAAAERTVHRLHHIRQVSDQAISVIDQVLEQAS
ncbi:hypothetical protein [Nonomuraea sp. NPDC048916]|uniref:hypothetical protein n=1 Tax=Nonomuraea sp. NPDC048916 TaxID=3154232 RepID=UPI0033D6DCDB